MSNNNKIIKQLINLNSALLLSFQLIVPLYAEEVSDFYKFSWSQTSGWFNFKSSFEKVVIYNDHLEGYVWAENIGWIRLGTHIAGGKHTYQNDSATNYGVNNDGTGKLSGYAWSETAGWINFNPQHNQVIIDPDTGFINGYAWGENIGWIHFNNSSPFYRLQTLLNFNVTVNPAVNLINNGILLQLQSTTTIAGNSNEINLLQNEGSGNVSANIGQNLIYLRPISYLTVSLSLSSPGIYIDSDGLLKLVSRQGSEVIFIAEPQQTDQLHQALSAYNLSSLKQEYGTLKITKLNENNEAEGIWYAARGDLESRRINHNDFSGIYLNSLDKTRYLIDHYFDSDGLSYKQTFFPVPADWDRLKHYLNSFGDTSMDYMGNIKFKLGNNTFYAMSDYQVQPTEQRIAELQILSTEDINDDGLNDYIIIYPNGDKQVLYLLNIE